MPRILEGHVLEEHDMAFLRQCLFEVRQHCGETPSPDASFTFPGDDRWHLGGHPEPARADDEARVAANDDAAVMWALNKH